MTRTIEPIVSAAWLEARLTGREGGAGRRLVIIDLRESRLFDAGHIPGSISIPFSPMSGWAVSDDELLMELPPDADLFELLVRAGIGPQSTVVLAGTVEPGPAPPYALSDPARVAATLFYAGVTDVAILDGGFPHWAMEGRAVIATAPGEEPPACEDAASWRGEVHKDMFVSTEYVKARVGQAVILDGRDPDQFFGVTACPFAGVGGHIPSARSLPAAWIWEEDGTYRPVEVLRAVAEGVVGPHRDQEIILYCGVGGYASAWWFVLTQALGYRDVKIYDGAAEAWVKGDTMVSYTW